MKKVYNDIVLSILANLLFTATSQLIVYPFLGASLSSHDFGAMLTIIGITNAISVIFGGSLNNNRLLLDKSYRESGIRGDFRRIFVINIGLTCVASAIGLLFFIHQITIIEFTELIALTLLISIRAYLTVSYRIKLNYVITVIHMLVTSIGYLCGVASFYYMDDWVLIFIIGELFSFVFMIFSIKFTFVSASHAELMSKAMKNYGYLISSNFVANLLLYMDRLLINPFLGPANVAVYYAASIVGKTSGIVLQPLSGVLLSYLSVNDKTDSWTNFKRVLLLSIALGGGIYLLTIPVTPIFMDLLYADLAPAAEKIYMLANLAAIILISSNLLQPVTLKYCPLWWQTMIQIVYAILYIGIGILCMRRFGLSGFVFSSLIANGLRYVMLIVLGYTYLKPKMKHRNERKRVVAND